MTQKYQNKNVQTYVIVYALHFIHKYCCVCLKEINNYMINLFVIVLCHYNKVISDLYRNFHIKLLFMERRQLKVYLQRQCLKHFTNACVYNRVHLRLSCHPFLDIFVFFMVECYSQDEYIPALNQHFKTLNKQIIFSLTKL